MTPPCAVEPWYTSGAPQAASQLKRIGNCRARRRALKAGLSA